MAEKNIIELRMTDQRAEEALAGAIEEFAIWREQNHLPSTNDNIVVDSDLPDIMVRTRLAADAVLKVLTFSDSQGASKFMSIWEDYASA
ncbi:MAG: hypothetical protein AAFS13_09295 [Pseudomonadota bacterium]